MIRNIGRFVDARVRRTGSTTDTIASIGRRTAALMLATAAATACGELPAAPMAPIETSADMAMDASAGAQRLVLEDFWDLTGHLQPFSCDDSGNYVDGEGEMVRLHGGIFSRYTATLTPSLNLLASHQVMPVGLGGVGVESGEEFRVHLQEHGHMTSTSTGSTEPYRYSMTLTGRSTGRRLAITVHVTYVVRDGEIILDRRDETVSCRAPVRG